MEDLKPNDLSEIRISYALSVRKLHVGSRICVDNVIGTIMYIGLVDGHKGTWYGVDWDDASRGKHNGSVGAIRYYITSSETSGSFVRPAKVKASVSCAEAIQNYYGVKEDVMTATQHSSAIDDWKKKIKVPFVEMIGFDSVQKKMSTLESLTEACVGGMCVWIGGALSSLCPSLHTLDISRSLIADWDTVADIVLQLPSLRTLDLSQNRLNSIKCYQEADILSGSFLNLRKVVLRSCHLNGKDFEMLSKFLTNAEELVATDNNIKNITISTLVSWKLTTLVLDNNPISSFNQVLKLRVLKNLKLLSLNNCGLKTIAIDEKVNEKTNIFKRLDTLFLKQNMINDWRSISELEKLRSLKKFYFSNNPVLEAQDYDTSVQLVIARIGNLKEFNGSEITREVRSGAEYDYLKRYYKSWSALSVDDESGRDEFFLFHARYMDLLKKIDIEESNLSPKQEATGQISDKLILIYFKDEMSGITISKTVSLNITIQNITSLIKRVFKTHHTPRSSVTPSLVYKYTNDEFENITVFLDNQTKDLAFYSISNGDVIHINW